MLGDHLMRERFGVYVLSVRVASEVFLEEVVDAIEEGHVVLSVDVSGYAVFTTDERIRRKHD
jgi:hypothetical protein